MSLIWISVLSLGGIGALSALILYVASQKFKVYEDPRIDEVEAALPSANCGGCGFAGCRNFADACVAADSLEKLNCPVGGAATMAKVADILGLTAVVTDKKVAVVRCSGSCDNRPRLSKYDGAQNCSVAALVFAGETGCTYGCLGFGECVDACQFDAIHMSPTTGLPEVVEDKCTACGACVKACPKSIIELRYAGKKSRRIYVSCVNKDKGAPAKRACKVACIGCMKCQKVCQFDAITIDSNLAYIDFEKCKLCRKCVEVCPQNTILELNFPARKREQEATSAQEETTNS